MSKKWLVASVLVSLIVSWVVAGIYFQPGFPYTHDGENHLARFANYELAIKEGQFPPRIAPNLHNRYGYPVFNYNYPLANILSLPLSFLKIDYQVSFGLMVFGAVLAGWWGSWWVWRLVVEWSRKRTSAETTHKWPMSGWAGLIVASAYVLSPYLIQAVYLRGNIGEIIAYSLLPWLVVCIYQLGEMSQKFGSHNWPMRQWLLVVVVVAAFLLSHNLAVLIATPLMVLIAVIFYGQKVRAYLVGAMTGIFSLALSWWFWWPALLEKHLVNIDQVGLSQDFADHFVSWGNLLFSSLDFGFSYPGSVTLIVPSLGASLAASLLLVMAVWLSQGLKLVKSREVLCPLGALLGMAVIYLFFALPISAPIWQGLSPLAIVQFPWRMMMVWPLIIILGLALIARFLPARLWLVLGVLVLIQLLIVIRLEPVDRFQRTREDLQAYTMSTSTQNENLPRSFNYQDIADWQPSASAFSGDAELKTLVWRGSWRRYLVAVAEGGAVIVEPTMRFAGWQTRVTRFEDAQQNLGEINLALQNLNNQTRVDYLDDDKIAGRLAYSLEPGVYLVESNFTQWTWARVVGNGASLVALSGWIIMWLAPKRSCRVGRFCVTLSG